MKEFDTIADNIGHVIEMLWSIAFSTDGIEPVVCIY